MMKPIIAALFAGLFLGVGGSMSFGLWNIEGLILALIAIISIGVSLSIIVYRAHRKPLSSL